ncbi:MAG: two-component sensor histidine kinase [Lysobacteraceae bacterium]|nr:MAG: two-component sensor histidine kinase [Xanthomonadaceae bacterium]
MKPRIFHRLFVSFLVASVSGSVLLAAYLQLRLREGFLDYVNRTDRAQVESMAGQLAETYSSAEALANISPHDWGEFWDLRRRPPGPRHDRQGPPRGNTSGQRRPESQSGPGERRTPPPPRADRAPPPLNNPRNNHDERLPLGLRVGLLDSNGQHIVGLAPDHTFGTTVTFQIVGNDEATIGLLLWEPLRELQSDSDIDFISTQSNALYAALASVLLLSALFAWYTARSFSSPLNRLGHAASKLANNELATQVDMRRQDEFGDLAKAFNHLAGSLDGAQQARRRWMADVVHELRTPLTIARGQIEAIDDGVRPFNREELARIGNSIELLAALVDDLQTLAMSDVGALNYKMKKLNLGRLLDECVQACRPTMEQHQLTVDWRSPKEDVVIWGDPVRWKQVINNLLGNSIRHTRSPGKIRVNLVSSDGSAVMTIEDSAPGVEPADLEHLSEPFFRLNPLDSPRGCGLGLTICRRIVDGHGASMLFKASALGGLAVRIVTDQVKP